MGKRILLAVLVAGALILLFNTRFGVFLVFDGLGDLFGRTDHFETSDPPLEVTAALTADTLPLPSRIEQASGIVVSDVGVWISTDQAELFSLDDQFAEVTAHASLLGGPLLLKQGSIEAIALTHRMPTRLAIAGEIGAVEQRQQFGTDWRVVSESRTSGTETAEFSGIAVVGEEHWLVSGERNDLYILERDQWFGLPVPEVELVFSGIAFDGRHVWVLSEKHGLLLRIAPEKLRLLSVYALGISEPSDVAVFNGKAYIVADHNYFDPRPPLYVYSLPLE